MARPSKMSEEEIFNGKEAIRAERERRGDCLWCPPNHNENAHGSKSRWGRKVAKKVQYRTGRGRKEKKEWYVWGLLDRHTTNRDIMKKNGMVICKCRSLTRR